jgi:hypothetical protein
MQLYFYTSYLNYALFSGDKSERYFLSMQKESEKPLGFPILFVYFSL